MPYDELAHKKSQREARIAAGLCAKCGLVPPAAKRRMCEKCSRLGAWYSAEWRLRNEAAVKVSDATTKRDARSQRRDAGVCVDCGRAPPRSGFVRCEACGEKRRAAGAKFRAADPDRQRWYVRKHRFGITREQWMALFASQGRRCAICQATEPGGGGGWHTDHNHATGTVRGVLCNECNLGLGHFRDDPMVMQRAARYVVIRGGKTNERQASLIEETAHA